jgi:hypothetical protein
MSIELPTDVTWAYLSGAKRIEFTIEAGYRKVQKLRLLVSEIDTHYSRLKSETGQVLNFECTKRPWESSLHVTIEGPSATVRDFLQRIRSSVEKLGLKGTPEHWHEMA